MDLSGKVALITGAARRVGKAIALALAARGVTVAVHYRNSAAQAADTVATIEASGGTVRAFHADLEKVSDIEAMVSDVATAFGRLDILVNSASVFEIRTDRTYAGAGQSPGSASPGELPCDWVRAAP